MAATLLGTSQPLQYISTGASILDIHGYMTATRANEAASQIRIPKAGKLRNLRAFVDANTGTTNTCTLTVRVNGSNSNLALVIPAGGTGEFLAPFEIAVAEGDLVCLQHNKANSTGGIIYAYQTCEYEADDGVATAIHVYSGRAINLTTAATRYAPLVANQRATTDGWKIDPTAWNAKDLMGAKGRFTSIRVNLAVNSFDVPTTFSLMVNGVDSGLSVTVAANSGAIRAVTTGGNVAINPGDTVGWRRDSAGRTSGNLQINKLEAVFESDDGTWDLMARNIEDAEPDNLGALPAFYAGVSLLGSAVSTFANRKLYLPRKSRISRFRSQVFNNAPLADWRTSVFSAGAATALQNPVPVSPARSNITSPVQNNTDTAVIGDADGISFAVEWATGGTSQNARSFYSAGVTIKQEPPATSYSNPGGSGERRTGEIVVTASTDLFTGTSDVMTLLAGTNISNTYFVGYGVNRTLTFDFGAPRVIDEVKWTQSTSASQGIWRWAGSNNGSDWTDIGPSFTLGGALISLHPSLHGNETAYRFYRLYHISGATSTGPWLYGVGFRIDDGQTFGGYLPTFGYGDRTSRMTLTAPGYNNPTRIYDGTLMNVTADRGSFSGGFGGVMSFDFGSPVMLKGGRLWQSATTAQGTWQWAGSLDGSSWTNIGAPFVLAPVTAPFMVNSGAAVFTFDSLAGNTTAFRYYRMTLVSGATSGVPGQRVINFLEGVGSGPPPPDPITVSPGPGALRFSGLAPSLIVDEFVSPPAGQLVFTGGFPILATTVEIDASPGELQFGGLSPTVFIGFEVSPPSGRLELRGGTPLLFTEFLAVSSQLAVLAVGEVIPDARASQMAVLAAGYVIPPVAVSQMAVLVMVDAQPCVSRRADIWIIERRDGVRMAFTSHDLPLPFGGLVATPCGSLTPTAIAQASEIGGMGNLELQGLIKSSLITEADLFAGLYDDAFVEVWRVSWDPALKETPERMAAGWWGNTKHGGDGFNVEVLGPGSRIQQQALVQLVTPGCRRDFGSPQGELPPGGCGVNREAYKVAGTVASAASRGRFTADLESAGTAPQYGNGLVRWLSGPNSGTACEVKSVDFGSGLVDLWAPTGFVPNPGDAFELLPGCDKLAATCKLYSNYINFGGFPDVPGTDAISETPDAKL